MPPLPTHLVAGVNDLDAASAFLAHLGFHERGEERLSGAAARGLYQLDGPTRQRSLAAGDGDAVWLRLVLTGRPPRLASPCEPQPLALRLLTPQLEATLSAACAAGAEVGGIVPFEGRRIAPLAAPGQLWLHLVEAEHTALDGVVWSAAPEDRPLAAWSAAEAWRVGACRRPPADAVARLLGLTGATPACLRRISAAGGAGLALELLQLRGDGATPRRALPLAAGLHALGLSVASLEEGRAALPGCAFDDAVEGLPGRRAAAGRAPGGVQLELWEEPAPTAPTARSPVPPSPAPPG